MCPRPTMSCVQNAAVHAKKKILSHHRRQLEAHGTLFYMRFVSECYGGLARGGDAIARGLWLRAFDGIVAAVVG